MSCLSSCRLGSMLVSASLLACLVRMPACAHDSQTNSPSATPTAAGAAPPIVPASMPDWFRFQSNDTVNGWINSLDNKALTQHAWELWGAITTLTEQEHEGDPLPVYETWWSIEEALAPRSATQNVAAGPRKILHLEKPRQLTHGRVTNLLAAVPSSLFSSVKYNDSIKKLIDLRKYNDGRELERINTGWGATKPIADRKLQDFDNDAVMLKPVYRLIPAKTVSIVSYWDGPSNSTKPSTPDPSTWIKKMMVLPPDLSATPSSVRVQDADEFLPAVPLSNFYHIKLTKDEAAGIGPRAKEGDYMIMVGMHVSSREIDNWTWQTFWWSFARPEIPEAVKIRVKAPFDHYEVAVGYSFVTAPTNPQSLNVVCFNPYLETGFDDTSFVYTPGQRGIESNCMSCHRTAAWPSPEAPYAGNGIIDPANPAIFGAKTKTDFLWGIADRVAAPAPNP